MCGRYTLRTNPRDFADIFSVVRPYEAEWQPAYNIAPTQNVLCIRDSDQREFFKAKLGTYSKLGEGRQNRLVLHQRSRRDGRYQARIPLCFQEASMPGNGRWFLRMAARRISNRISSA